MKVSLNWVKEFTEASMPIDQLVAKIGAQLGAVDDVVNLGERYKDAVIVKVIASEKHPDADKLSVCLIDDNNKVQDVERNSDGLVQVVCGAPNVHADMLAVWLPPKSVVPATAAKDPFTLEAREIRGVVSNGMLASAQELGIGDDHTGIVDISETGEVGASFAQTYALDDYIIDIENKMFTHRPDCFGMLGIAREIAGICNQPFVSPDWYRQDVNIQTPVSESLPLAVSNGASQQVSRFTAVTMSNITVGPSPLKLQTYLSRVGVKPINNVVDVTNYVTWLSGQPLHAYDYDKLKALSGQAALGTRISKDGEELRIIGGKTIKLRDGAVVITSGDKVVGLGGVMGGADTEVDENTKNIVLECASFDMNLTRKTSMEYGLFTDAATRFTKGQSPLQNLAVLCRAVEEIGKLAGGKLAGPVQDIHSDLPQPTPVFAETSFINSRLGLSLTDADIDKLLGNVEFKVSDSEGKRTVTPPFWRTDIALPEDIVEEVGRLYGYEHLPLNLPQRSVEPPEVDKQLAFKTTIRSVLSAAGANEVLTYSFVNGSLLDKVGQAKEAAFHIKNALSPALQYYRISLMPSLLEKVHPNIKNGFDKFALFEMGKGHIKKHLKDGELPNEMNILALAYADSTKSADGAAYYQAKRYLDYLAQAISAGGLIYEPLPPELDFAIVKPFEPQRSALVKTADGNMLGIIGEFKTDVARSLKLPARAAGFELDLSVLANAQSMKAYYPLNKYPETIQDITLRMASGTTYAAAEKVLSEALMTIGTEQGYIYQLKPLGIFQKPEDKDYKQLTWRIALSHPDKTLTTEEVNSIFGMLESSAKEKFNGSRV